MTDMFDPRNFQEEEQTKLDEKLRQQRDYNAHFDEAKLQDLQSRKKLRYWVAGSIGFIMLIQFVALYYFVFIAFQKNNVIQLKWLFVSLFGGTLTETYFLVKLIVIWLFKDVPYRPDCDKIEK